MIAKKEGMTHAETIEKLCSLRNHGSKFGIDRMRLLSEAIGAPQKHFPAIHLAGTNGKGSTSAMLESILRNKGLRVGLYTSPHLPAPRKARRAHPSQSRSAR